MRDYLKINLRLARSRKKYLGLNHVPKDVYERILQRAKCEYRRINIRVGLTWPEYVVVIAHLEGYDSRNQIIAGRLQLLYLIETAGGVTRGSCNLEEYLTWDGWEKLPKK